ncbi:hypothetical protein ACFL2B_02085 [Patescibacteria group bacterium]
MKKGRFLSVICAAICAVVFTLSATAGTNPNPFTIYDGARDFEDPTGAKHKLYVQNLGSGSIRVDEYFNIRIDNKHQGFWADVECQLELQKKNGVPQKVMLWMGFNDKGLVNSSLNLQELNKEELSKYRVTKVPSISIFYDRDNRLNVREFVRQGIKTGSLSFTHYLYMTSVYFQGVEHQGSKLNLFNLDVKLDATGIPKAPDTECDLGNIRVYVSKSELKEILNHNRTTVDFYMEIMRAKTLNIHFQLDVNEFLWGLFVREGSAEIDSILAYFGLENNRGIQDMKALIKAESYLEFTRSSRKDEVKLSNLKGGGSGVVVLTAEETEALLSDFSFELEDLLTKAIKIRRYAERILKAAG